MHTMENDAENAITAHGFLEQRRSVLYVPTEKKERSEIW